ncbi:RING/U-box superfamily protein [Striga asiatica]|uniref:RING-type E3 ubiquitin transferase n=1 Tax=Striga asiatica TaxID=4170 RepID=A0A5A7QW45_STRAF|nr:RING/U-box superfamily protein [Striga asiatica]
MLPDVSTNFSLATAFFLKNPTFLQSLLHRKKKKRIPILSAFFQLPKTQFLRKILLLNSNKMASETDFSSEPLPTFIEHLAANRHRDISFILPLILGLTSPSPPHETQDEAGPRQPRGRFILVSPFATEINGGKNGRPPASKASIDALESLEIENDDEPCVVCLEDWEIGEKAKKMPCGHRFHGKCVERWLNIHGSCPVCRYDMPVEEDEDGDKRGIWVGFGFGWVDSSVRNWSSRFRDSDQEMQQG